MLKIRAMRQPFRGKCVSIFIDDVPTSPDEPYLTAKPLIMETVKTLYEEAIPTTTIKSEAAQELMDDLWACGLRPSEGTGSAGQLAAVQAHLKDFKTILFKKLNISQE